MKKYQSKAVDSISDPVVKNSLTTEKIVKQKQDDCKVIEGDISVEFPKKMGIVYPCGISVWKSIGKKYKYFDYFEQQIRKAELEWILEHLHTWELNGKGLHNIISKRLDKINKAKI